MNLDRKKQDSSQHQSWLELSPLLVSPPDLKLIQCLKMTSNDLFILLKSLLILFVTFFTPTLSEEIREPLLECKPLVKNMIMIINISRLYKFSHRKKVLDKILKIHFSGTAYQNFYFYKNSYQEFSLIITKIVFYGFQHNLDNERGLQKA